MENMEYDSKKEYGDKGIWSLKDGVLTILPATETKLLKFYAFSLLNNKAWKKYREHIHTLKIQDGVTTIGNPGTEGIDGYAFEGYRNLSIAYIPKSVPCIGEKAFYDCHSLNSIDIPANIGEGAFERCYSLNTVVISNGVTSIGKKAFKGCVNLVKLRIPGSVTSIGDHAFSYCESLKTVTVPSGVTCIGDYAFLCCESLESVTIPDSVTSIGKNVFLCCENLTDVCYGGSEEQWRQISIDSDNEALTRANIHFNR